MHGQRLLLGLHIGARHPMVLRCSQCSAATAGVATVAAIFAYTSGSAACSAVASARAAATVARMCGSYGSGSRGLQLHQRGRLPVEWLLLGSTAGRSGWPVVLPSGQVPTRRSTATATTAIATRILLDGCKWGRVR